MTERPVGSDTPRTKGTTDDSELELEFPDSVTKTFARRRISRDQVRRAIGSVVHKEKTGPTNVVCLGMVDDKRALKVQYSIVNERKYRVLHASWAENYV
ncbi:MAG: hypothetical protein IH987_13785 [Planctomycetes bacterium]|nr:hypothetical protein [Planctomycetota bacterium]